MLYDDFSLALHEFLARNFWCDTLGGDLRESRLRINRAHSIIDAKHSLDAVSIKKQLRDRRSAWRRTEKPHQDKDCCERSEVDKKLEGGRPISVADQGM